MSDKPAKTGWSEHEILVCLLNAIDHSGTTLDFKSIAYPAGRTASGFTQKFTALKKALKPELDAINAGQPVPDVPVVPKKATSRKRKAAAVDEDGEAAPKKRGRAKKNAASEAESESPVQDGRVKDEPEEQI